MSGKGMLTIGAVGFPLLFLWEAGYSIQNPIALENLNSVGLAHVM